MGYKNSTRVSIKVSVSVRTALLYSSLGIAVGALFCSIIFLFTNLFRSDDVYAGRCNGIVSLSQTICAGDSANLTASGGDFYRWVPSNGLSDVNTATPKASPAKSNTYTVTIYKALGSIIDESGRYSLTSEMMSGKDKNLFVKKEDVEPGHDFVLQFQARSVNYLDKGVIDIMLNGKTVGTYNIDYKFNQPFTYIWNNRKDDHAEVTIALKSFDGDGEAIECGKISLKALASTTASTAVIVDKHCKQCSGPQGVKETIVSNQSVKLSWDKNDKGKNVLRYKRAGEKNWKYVRTRSCSYILEELDPSFDYIVQMMCYCDKKQTDSSAWSNIILMKSSDRLIADVMSKNEHSYKGVLLPIVIIPDSMNYVLEATFGVDSPSDEVRLEVWNDKGKRFYSNYLPVQNGKVDERLRFSQSLNSGKYMVRIVDGDKTYMNQFEVQ